MQNISKIVHKGSVWSKHGRRRGLLGIAQETNRAIRSKSKPETEWFGSMQELMCSRKK